MKATIDFDPALYRRLKIEAARRGSTIRELVAEGIRYVLAAPSVPVVGGGDASWQGSLKKYASNAGGSHDIASIRKSIASGRGSRE